MKQIDFTLHDHILSNSRKFTCFSTDSYYNTLSQNYNAKLSDFGLAKDGPTGDKSHVSTRVMGTYGYAAPEYLATGIIPWTSLFRGSVLFEIYHYLKDVQ